VFFSRPRINRLNHNRLWDVIEITAEQGSKYKVKWAGTDPQTGKPWGQSWVAKRDCTDGLVGAWKMKQQKRKEKNAAAKKHRLFFFCSKKKEHIFKLANFYCLLHREGCFEFARFHSFSNDVKAEIKYIHDTSLA
jgi:hypothetical protein